MQKSETVLVCFALKEEAGAFNQFTIRRKDVSILITGIGRKNAEMSARDFLRQNSPQRVFTCGFTGGLNPELKLGDVIFEMPLTPALSPSDVERVSAKVLAAGGKPAKFFCAPRIATTAAEKAELRRTTGADAVEMESEAIHAVCRERGIPCATVRVISDTAGEDLPLDFNRLANADFSLNYGRLAWAVAKSPGKIPAVLRLQKNTAFAAMQLADVLVKVIGPG